MMITKEISSQYVIDRHIIEWFTSIDKRETQDPGLAEKMNPQNPKTFLKN